MKIFCCLVVFIFHFSSYALDDLIKAIRNLNQSVENRDLKKEEPVKPSVQFKIEKEHRLLDAIARQISEEFLLTYPSVSVAWIKNHQGEKILLVSFNDRDPGIYSLVKALRNIAKKSHFIGNTTPHLGQNISVWSKKLKNIRQQIAKGAQGQRLEKLKVDFHKTRIKIDFIKLHLATYPGHPKYNKELAIFFNNINRNNVILLKNPYQCHSELNIIHHLLTNNLIYGYYQDNLGRHVPYQYIGNSMNCCGKCDCLIRGNEDIVGLNDIVDSTHMAIFTRGKNPHVFPGKYNIPKWAMEINNKDYNVLRRILSKLPKIKKLEKSQYFIDITHEPSESSDDDGAFRSKACEFIVRF